MLVRMSASGCLLLWLCLAPISAAEPAADSASFADVALQPFWKAKELSESMFFIQPEAGSRPQSSLLFRPKKIVRVTSATRETVFEAGRDYVFEEESATFHLPEGSRIPFKTMDDLYPLMTSDAPKIPKQAGDKTRGVFFDNADGYHQLQVEVTYEVEPGQWKGPVPEFAGDTLPKTMAKLRSQQPVRMLLCGDSISAGYNASKYSNAKPLCPAYGELVALGLEKKYGSPVTFTNYAVGGWNAAQGVKHATEEAIGKQHPDLVIIAFGMNDVFARDAAAYQNNIRALMETIRKDSPDTEFVLVATMLGNAEWGMPMEQFPLYQQALRELRGPGVAFADLTAVWEELLKRKSFYDLTGNGVNHPNDFGHGIYAQVVAALLVEPAESR